MLKSPGKRRFTTGERRQATRARSPPRSGWSEATVHPNPTLNGSSGRSSATLSSATTPVTALVALVAGQVNTAEVLFAAELEHRTWGLRRYRARLTPGPDTIVLAIAR